MPVLHFIFSFAVSNPQDGPPTASCVTELIGMQLLPEETCVNSPAVIYHDHGQGSETTAQALEAVTASRTLEYSLARNDLASSEQTEIDSFSLHPRFCVHSLLTI